MAKKSSFISAIRSLVVAGGSTLLLMGLAQWGWSHVARNASHSVHPKWFILERYPVVKKGDYVFFPWSDPRLARGRELILVKRVACLPGERLLVGRGQAVCEGEVLGRLRTEPPPVEFEGVIPEGKLFVMGDSEDSFDSRYFGLIDQSRLLARSYARF